MEQNNTKDKKKAADAKKPLILAPAGNRASFFAALSAGADAVYCGLKHFSARMNAENFTVEELVRLTAMAHDRGVAVHVALNSLVKPGEIDKAGILADALSRHIRPDAVIIQDLCFLDLLRKSGFAGQVHLSTLAAVTFAGGLKTVSLLPGVSQVVLPRELNIDEIREMAAACPPDLGLEVFVHGALCYAVSGRCYWSSYLGGKSGLRGRCVQPCRRMYSQKEKAGRFFSCLDLSLDVLVKPLLSIPEISTWKIEGRKKGPHYVYYTITAYKMLRDEGGDPAAKKTALQYLEQALGRKPTHYYFLPQRPYAPTTSGDETASGLFVGNVAAGGKTGSVSPRFNLLSGDLLRIGYEDRPGHGIYRVGRAVPRKGRLYLTYPSKKPPAKGTPVFLIDRMEKTLREKINALEEIFQALPEQAYRPGRTRTPLPAALKVRPKPREMHVYRSLSEKGRPRAEIGLWLSRAALRQAASRNLSADCWWWLPPVVWQNDAEKVNGCIAQALAGRARRFVINAPWQLAFFSRLKSLEIWAGPFCNLSNSLSLDAVGGLGCAGAIVSPELAGADFLSLADRPPLPLGIVVAGLWPLCLSRTAPVSIKPGRSFLSPRKEASWVVEQDSSFWVYPNWSLNIQDRQKQLEKKGYSLFIRFFEPIPEDITLKNRPGIWNWEEGPV